MLPKDPVILLSYVNTKLRDMDINLDKLCDEFNVEKNYIIDSLKNIGYEYNDELNQFK